MTTKTCPICRGTGQIWKQTEDILTHMPTPVATICGQCHGKGKIPNQTVNTGENQ